MNRVVTGSPRQRAFEARRHAATALIGIALVRPNPTLSYEREAVPGLDASDDFVRLGWSLDLGGRRGLSAEVARAGAQAERHEVELDELVLLLHARGAYLEAVYARAHLAALDAARAPLAELAAALASRAKHGDASSYDVDRAGFELDGLDDDRATARRQLELARLRLGQLVGEPATPYDASEPLELPSGSELTPPPRRPEVDAARVRATQAERAWKLARRGWVPRLELVAGVVVSSSMGGDGVGYTVGIGGDLPLFDRGAATAERSRADAKRWRTEAAALAHAAHADRVQARRELALRVEQARAYLAGPATRASDLQRRAVVAYREGDRPILELLDVLRSARHAATRGLELIYQARRAELDLRRALGSAR